MSGPAAIMFQGTGSDVGKSLLVAGLCRALQRRGRVVRPFKPQNMSNNAAATAAGGEIGRAQALQARACGVAPHTDMNPVLLKPQAECGAQVIVQGQVWGTLSARAYQAEKGALLGRVLESFHRLAVGADIVLVEGAGSAAEINLRAGDIANMGFAEAAGLPVVLVADIDRGGVIASVVGTHAVLPPAERARIQGYIINKFRGDVRLFDSGLAAITGHSGWPSLGVVPWFPAAARLPAEDSQGLERSGLARNGLARNSGMLAHPKCSGSATELRIAVPHLPRIANFDDLDPLAQEPGVRLQLIAPGTPLPGDAHLVILPGSKATCADLAFFKAQGWEIDLHAHVRRGGRVLGLCGGYQMLGRRIADPHGVEGPAGVVPGLGLLDIETTLLADKTVRPTTGVHCASGAPVTGYEIHAGHSAGPGCARPFLRLNEQPDGAVSPDGRVAGGYLHGLFAGDAFRTAFLAELGASAGGMGTEAGYMGYEAGIEATLDALAEHLEAHVDINRLLMLAGCG